MNSTITIDANIYKEAEVYARQHNVSLQAMVEKYFKALISVPVHKKASHAWESYALSPEVMAMTFSERKQLPTDYESEYVHALTERYQ